MKTLSNILLPELTIIPGPIPETYIHLQGFPEIIWIAEPGFSRDSPNSRAGLFPRLSELPSRAFPETLLTPELGFPRDSPNSRAGLFPRLSELPNRVSPETLRTPESGFSRDYPYSRTYNMII